MNEKIHIWLKIFYKPEKGSLLSCLENLSFWIRTFKDRDKYHITIYSENIELPKQYYPDVEIVNRQYLIDNSPECKNLQERIQNNNNLSSEWKNAASALSFCYYWSAYEYIWNIDASDIHISSDKTEYYFDRAFKDLKEKNLPQLSWDIYLLPNKQWSYGVNISRREMMKNIIEGVLPVPIRDLGWGKNLDAMITNYFAKQTDKQPIVFTTPDFICHEGIVDKGLCSRWNEEKNMMETNFYGNRVQYGKLMERCLLVR